MRGAGMFTMLHCRWSGKRLDRYLDRDPSALLTDEEISRLERHLAGCPRCARTAGRQRALSQALARSWEGPAPEVLLRARERLALLAHDSTP